MLSYPPQKVQLRNKKTHRQKIIKENRKSSGYYSPVASMYDSSGHLHRSSLVLDSSGRTSARSSGYNSPVNSERSSFHLDEEDEGEQKQHKQSQAKLQKTHSTDASWSGPINERSDSPLITNQRTRSLSLQRNFESSQN